MLDEGVDDTILVDLSDIEDYLAGLGRLSDLKTTADPPKFPVGFKIGNLEIVALIGQGGMGTVYRAEHITLGTPYAIKVLHDSEEGHSVAAERFRREAMACSQLRHPSLVFVTDFGVNDELGFYLVMEFLDGESLETRLKGGKFPLWRALTFAAQLCDGLSVAHHAGITHRDLKPDNIYVVETPGQLEQVKVLDFGVARFSNQKTLTAAGAAIGTPNYMAPEQILGDNNIIGPVTDIYALGGILYEMVTGQPPFEGSQLEVMHQQLKAERPLLGGVRPDLAGTQLEELVHEMLAIDATERPSSCTIARERLQRAQNELLARGISDIETPDLSSAGRQSGSEVRTGGTLKPTLGHGDGSLQLLSKWGSTWLRSEVPPLVLFLGVWGFVSRELLDASPDSEHFIAACAVAIRIGLDVCDDERAETADVEMMARCVGDLWASSNAQRQVRLKQGLGPLLNHPRLALWSAGLGKGASVKSILTMDVRDLFKKSRDK
jgi:serine/threonine protein kinase